MKKLFFSIIATLCITAAAMAQVPSLMNYQAVALNSSGSPIANTTIKIRVKIHTGTATGTVQYLEERSVTTDAFGHFDFQIDGPGKIIGAGTLAGVTWNTGDKFLQIEMDPTNGSTFIDMGTQQLVAVPFANFSQSAEKLKLPYNGTDGSAETFKITNTSLTGKGIIANVTNSGATAIEANGGSGVAIKANNNAGGISAITASNTSGTAITANGSPISNSDGVLEVNATATAGYAIVAQSGGSSGTVRATNSNTSNGVAAIYGEANSVGQKGVEGRSTNGNGVFGSSVTDAGVFGVSDNAVGVSAFSSNGTGLLTQSTNGTALKVNGATELNGVLKITGGNPGAGKVLTSDATGNTSWKAPLKVAFESNITTHVAASIPPNVWVIVPLPNESYDAGGNFNTNSAATDPNTFIAPVSGAYMFSAKAGVSMVSSFYNMLNISIALSINGVDSGFEESDAINCNSTICTGSANMSRTVHLNAGDKVRVALKHGNNGGITADWYQRSFSGHLVFAD